MKKMWFAFFALSLFVLLPSLKAKEFFAVNYQKCFSTNSVKTMCKPMIMDTGVGGQIIIDAFDDTEHYTLWLRRPYAEWSFCKEVLRDIRHVIRKSKAVCFQGDAFEDDESPKNGKKEINMAPDVIYNDVGCWNYVLGACKKRKIQAVQTK